MSASTYTLLAVDCALKHGTTSEEVERVSKLDDRTLALVSELSCVTVCWGSGGAAIDSFQDSEIIAAIKFLRSASVGEQSFVREAHRFSNS